MAILEKFSGFLWGWFLILILLGTELFLTARLRLVQLRYFGKMFKNVKKSMKKEEGVSGFGALCATLGAQVGTGNLVGVASALVSGGPGAVFWMWVTALIGMATNFSEVVLGQLYHEKDSEGNYVGGPCYYITKGMKNKPLAITYACLLYTSNVNASGRRCASTVFIMLVSGLILYLVYGVGGRDLGERLELKEKRKKRREKFLGHFQKSAKVKAAAE